MSVSLPNGATISIASGYASPKTISAISNANPGVASCTGNGYSNGDIVEVTSGWSQLTQKIVRVTADATDVFSLENIDTTLTTVYPSAGGAGSARKVTGWTQLAQILTSTSSGGEQQFLEYQLLEADAQSRIPTIKTAYGMTFSVADDTSLAGYVLAVAANDDRLPRAIKVALPTGAFIYYNAYVTADKVPSLTVNTLMACQITLSLLAQPVRYAS